MKTLQRLKAIIKPKQCPRELAGYDCRLYRGHKFCNDCGRGKDSGQQA